MRAVTLADLDCFRLLVARHLGLQVDDHKLSALEELLQRRLAERRLDAPTYLASLDEPDGSAEELRLLARELTVQETYFFRHKEQLAAFVERALPARLKARAAERSLAILCAGCASGEELYTLAMLLEDRRASLPGWEFALHGVDVNTAGLARAARGRYSAWSLRDLPPEQRQRWFRVEGREHVLDEALRRRVTFAEANLALEQPALLAPRSLDVIFCRNVLMYLTPLSAQSLVARLARALRPGGFLFLGHAETLRGLSKAFHLIHSHEAFYYQRKEPSGAPAAPGDEGPVAAPLEPELAGLLDRTDNWSDAIRAASDEVKRLTATRGSRASAPAAQATLPDVDPAPRVWELLRQERFGDARALVGQLPEVSARQPETLLLRALLHTHGGDLASAEALCLEVLASDELNAEAHYVMALCRESAGDAQAAQDHDQMAIYLDPAFAMPRLHLGQLHCRRQAHDRAREELSRALVLLPREDSARILLYGGGFGREGLAALAEVMLARCGGPR
ncbi:MAG: methyltransferase domain-containing protein [Deltaproteobacteria bacterium]|nr:methyltransferase domain-containing protein [Deltaproteobacteria bacterium]